MKIYKTLLIYLFITINAYAKEDKVAYQDCILQYITGTEDKSATNILSEACRVLYIDNFILLEKEKNYNQCLLEYLQGSKNRDESIKIKNTCNEKYRSFFN